MLKGSKRFYWRSVFDEVMATYVEARWTAGSHQAINYERALEGTGGSHAIGVVKPTLVDFLADVEVCAKVALNGTEFAFFADIATGRNPTQEELKDDKFVDLYNRVREKMGRLLIQRHVYPFARYMKAKDTR